MDKLLTENKFMLVEGNSTWRHRNKSGIPKSYLDGIAGKKFDCIEDTGMPGSDWLYQTNQDVFDGYKAIPKFLCVPILQENLDKILNE